MYTCMFIYMLGISDQGSGCTGLTLNPKELITAMCPPFNFLVEGL